MQHDLSDAIGAKLHNPGTPFQAARVGAIDQVNQGYASLDTRLQSQFSGRGMGRSGKIVTNARANEAARIGDLGRVNANYDGQQANYEGQIRDQAARFAFSTPGSSGTMTTPNTGLSDGLNGGLSSVATLYGLNQLLKGGGLQNPGGEKMGPPQAPVNAGDEPVR